VDNQGMVVRFRTEDTEISLQQGVQTAHAASYQGRCFPGVKVAEVKQQTHLHPLPRLRMPEDISLK